MTLSHDETRNLIELVLEDPRDQARSRLNDVLKLSKRSEGEFYAGIIEHGSSMKLTTDQWFELLSRLPNRMLRSQLDLQCILSEEHRKRLPPTAG